MIRKPSCQWDRSSVHLAAPDALSSSAGEPPDDGARRITVVLGRFETLVGRGLTQILREDRNLRIIDTDLEDTVLERVVMRLAPRVAILDETSAVQTSVLERLRVAQPATGIVVLAHRPTVAYGMRLFALGASCLSKDVSAANILAAVHVAAEGRRVFAADDGRLIERSYPDTAASLTPREVEVLEYLSRRQSHAEIAHALQVSPETIRTHSAHIRAKLGVHSNRDLIGLPIPFNSGAKIR